MPSNLIRERAKKRDKRHKKKAKKQWEKKLSEKGKLKLAHHRALGELQKLLLKGEQVEDEQLLFEELREEAYAQVENQQEFLKTKKITRLRNKIANAKRVGLVNETFSLELELEKKRADKRNRRADKVEERMHLDDPEEVIMIAFESALLGKKALLQFLDSSWAKKEMERLDDRVLVASLEADFHGRMAPLNIKVAMLWRFCSTIMDYHAGSRKSNLKLAIEGFELLIRECDSEEHPFEYAALLNSQEIATHDLDCILTREGLEEANNEAKLDRKLPLNTPRTTGFRLFKISDFVLPEYPSTEEDEMKLPEMEASEPSKEHSD